MTTNDPSEGDGLERPLDRIASALRSLGLGEGERGVGAIEGHGMHLGEALGGASAEVATAIADGASELSEAIRELAAAIREAKR